MNCLQLHRHAKEQFPWSLSLKWKNYLLISSDLFVVVYLTNIAFVYLLLLHITHTQRHMLSKRILFTFFISLPYIRVGKGNRSNRENSVFKHSAPRFPPFEGFCFFSDGTQPRNYLERNIWRWNNSSSPRRYLIHKLSRLKSLRRCFSYFKFLLSNC